MAFASMTFVVLMIVIIFLSILFIAGLIFLIAGIITKQKPKNKGKAFLLRQRSFV